MIFESENIEPVTDLGLALGNSNHDIQRRSSNDLGAGANAASRIDETFVATDPPSELVWSPREGPSNMFFSLQQTDASTRSSDDKPIDEEISHKSVSTFHDMNPKVANIVDLDKSSGNDDTIKLCHEQQTDNDNTSKVSEGIADLGEDLNPKIGESDENLFEENDLVDSKGAYFSCRDNTPVAEIADAIKNNFPGPRPLDERKPDVVQLSRMEIVLASKVYADNKHEAFIPPAKNSTSPGRKQDESASLMDKKGKSKMKGYVSSTLLPMEKLEATAENNLRVLVGDDAYFASTASSSESVSEAEKNVEHYKKIKLEEISGDKHSPTDSRILRYRRKGKENALYDGDVKLMSQEEDDSQESVESCNSAGLFSTGKKQWGFKQQLIVGRKRVKRQMGESPCSSSLVKQDSSFMNWISNMMKGFLKSKDKAPSLTLTVANPNQSHESPVKNPDATDRNQDPPCRNIGAGSPAQPKISSMNLSLGKSTEGNSSENQNPCNVAVEVEKDRASSSSFLGKRRAMNSENIDSDTPSEGKTVHNIGYKSNLLGNLWISRFTPKSSSFLPNHDNSGAVECSCDCMKITPCSNVNVSSDLKIVEAKRQCVEEPLIGSGKELPSDTDIEASVGFKEIIVQNDQKSKCNASPILPSARIKDSEISDNEIEDLMRNLKSSNKLEVPRLCIRCFGLDHWAVACPTTSRSQHQSTCRASLANLSEQHGSAGFEENKNLLEYSQEAIAPRTIQVGIDYGKDSNTSYGVNADKMRSTTNVDKKYVSSSLKENELKEDQMTPWGNTINHQVSDRPKAIFDAVRLLRLLRTDILKCMNSQISIAHLEGFFLRLRLGKREEGLRGTGYYVACISVSHTLGIQQNSKNSISVDVGGIKCFVESQYISNHDFLEVEIRLHFSIFSLTSYSKSAADFAILCM
ncbi:Zinc knuckle family protein, putative isoform 3 [Hibiscus syriacus]|uniref:Zinc knuckle family protein, putative isoform 3 n=1 Tax=Hibiscus syriacus TaxID=106335 RepID=A0A6A3BN59_HIBSY|nr:Zinc knuckle family protein, putative isoform 3 [Hibiscus syriacus]